MQMLFVALLVFVPSFSAALSVTGVDVGPNFNSLSYITKTHLQPKNDDIKLLKDRILGKI
jgi:hypothetical protein